MKSNLLFLLMMVVGVLLHSSCKTTKYPNTAEVTYINSPVEGVIVVKAKGYGKDTKTAQYDAYVTAFSTILFKGLPAFSPLSNPLIANESSARSTHSAYFRKLFDERGYMQFVTDQGSTTALVKADDRKNKSLTHTFSINYQSFKKDLIQNGLVRKLGL